MEQLLDSYQRIFTQQIEQGELSTWAQHKKNNPNELVRPTIPFVGKNYSTQKTKILLYASAENLSDYLNEKKGGGWLDDDAKAINRHRWYKDLSNNFFPWVHITPINDGSLLIVLRYICERLHIDMPDNPNDFMENIAFANFGKFSIEVHDGKNRDPKGRKVLDFYIEYVKQDISLLRPNIIVMFNSIYKTEKQNIEAIKGNAKIIRIYQINKTTVSKIISKNPLYPPIDAALLSPTIRNWYSDDHFKSYTGNHYKNFLSVFTYLDKIISKQIHE